MVLRISQTAGLVLALALLSPLDRDRDLAASNPVLSETSVVEQAATPGEVEGEAPIAPGLLSLAAGPAAPAVFPLVALMQGEITAPTGPGTAFRRKAVPPTVAGGGGPVFEDDGVLRWGVDPGTAAQELVANVNSVAVGDTATAVTVYGDDTSVTFTVYEVDITTGGNTSLGSGTVGTELDITNSTATDDNYLAIRVDTASNTEDTVYGAKVKIGGEEPPATIYSTPFTDATGWSFVNSQPDVVWAVDGTPAGAPIPDGPFDSGPSSLNYNNGTNYDDAAMVGNNGTATSDGGLIDLTGSTDPELTFWCNYETESTMTDFDPRFLRVSNDGFSTLLVDAQLATVASTGGVGDCSATGVGHTHTVALDPAWGSVQVRFFIDTIDDIANTGAGWFIDTLSVTHTPQSPPAEFIRVTPDEFMVNDD